MTSETQEVKQLGEKNQLIAACGQGNTSTGRKEGQEKQGKRRAPQTGAQGNATTGNRTQDRHPPRKGQRAQQSSPDKGAHTQAARATPAKTQRAKAGTQTAPHPGQGGGKQEERKEKQKRTRTGKGGAQQAENERGTEREGTQKRPRQASLITSRATVREDTTSPNATVTRLKVRDTPATGPQGGPNVCGVFCHYNNNTQKQG